MKIAKRLAPVVVAVALLVPGLAAAANFVVIVNPVNKVGSMTRTEVQRYFLRNATTWPDGESCKPVDLPKSNAVRVTFSSEVLGRSMTALDHFWTQSVFSGRAVPPPERKSEREVIEFVRDNPGAIAYVSAGAVLEGVRKVNVTD